jgi:hypothetical protein
MGKKSEGVKTVLDVIELSSKIFKKKGKKR